VKQRNGSSRAGPRAMPGAATEGSWRQRRRMRAAGSASPAGQP